MIGVIGQVIIILMTANTNRGKSGVGTIGMALGTILQIMALGQWEKVMVDRRRGPTGTCAMA